MFSSTAAKASNGAEYVYYVMPENMHVYFCIANNAKRAAHIAKKQRIGIIESCKVLAVEAALPSEALDFPRALFGGLCAIVRAFRITALFVCPCQIGELLQIVYRISSMRTCILTCLVFNSCCAPVGWCFYADCRLACSMILNCRVLD